MLSMISKKRWGSSPSDLEEQEVMIKNRSRTLTVPHPTRKIFWHTVCILYAAYSYRVFRIGTILPEFLYDNTDFDRILKSEMNSINKLAYFYDGSLNETVAKKAFPGLLIDQFRQTVNEIGQDNY